MNKVATSSAVQHVPRQPVQGRSHASLERMLEAARALMIERGNDDFTLLDVGRRGGVSTGSIYCRFNSKDELIRAVQAAYLAELEVRQEAMVAGIARRASSLPTLLRLLVHEIADLLRAEGPLLRPIMLRANIDEVVRESGKDSYRRFAATVARVMLAYRVDIRRDNAERSVNAAFRILYATLARVLGFGAAQMETDEGDWPDLKDDLAAMCTAFLTGLDPTDRSPCSTTAPRTSSPE